MDDSDQVVKFKAYYASIREFKESMMQAWEKTHGTFTTWTDGLVVRGNYKFIPFLKELAI